MRKEKPRKYDVDGREYAVSISVGEIDEEDTVHLRITIRALFGNRSVCLVRGVTNRSFWHDYPYVEQMRKESISVTPKVVCGLISRAHSEGWNPEGSRTNFEMFTNKESIRALTVQEHCDD